MPAQDLFHQAVKSALVKDGWTITHDPLFLPSGEVAASILKNHAEILEPSLELEDELNNEE